LNLQVKRHFALFCNAALVEFGDTIVKYSIKSIAFFLKNKIMDAVSSINNVSNNTMRIMASNILGVRGGDSVRGAGKNLSKIRSKLQKGGMAELIFKSKISTIELAEMANKLLEKRNSVSSHDSEFEEMKAILNNRAQTHQGRRSKTQVKTKIQPNVDIEGMRTAFRGCFQAQKEAQSKVGVGQFQRSNPIIEEALTTLKKIDVSRVKAQREKLGEGSFGKVYACTVKVGHKRHEIVVKIPTKEGKKDIDIETAVGDALRKALGEMKFDSLASDYQGLAMIAVPLKLDNGIEIQERIKGMDGHAAMSRKKGQRFAGPFKNGFVDDPQKEIGRAGGFVLGLHGMHQAGKVHHDLKLQNIMVEESGDDFRLRIIDLGAAADTGGVHDVFTSNGAPEYVSPRSGERRDSSVNPSYDMYALGTMLPSLFFGRGAKSGYGKFYGQNGEPSEFVQRYRDLENTLAKQMLDPEVQECLEKRRGYEQECESVNLLEVDYKKKQEECEKLEEAYEQAKNGKGFGSQIEGMESEFRSAKEDLALQQKSL
jgi:hypothetical protein